MSKITIAQGAGGERMLEFIKEFVLNELEHDSGEIPLSALDDAAVVDGIVFTTDSYTVKPLFFPGGDIGLLSVAGTVNDVSVMGARPLALSCGMIIEEGFSGEDLHAIMRSMGATAKRAGVGIVTGDTKVVERGAADGLFINTSGIGRRSEYLDGNIKRVRASRDYPWNWPNDSAVADGDVIIVSGPIGNHGVALLSFREGYGFETAVKTDAAPLNSLIEAALRAGGVTAMKDPTRGGLANLLNEWAEKSSVGIAVREEDIPLEPAVLSACEMLGIDPLEIGNEGKVVIAAVPEAAEGVLKAIRAMPEGRSAQIAGKASADIEGVILQTHTGGKRMIEPPVGDPVPRIC
ncbi:MAG: hydrogenase expression/formation protein HypE [Thermoplasmata archaeon]|nr:hydrogenase expression/formation protein HypE [Thermoplasmata archaeon]